MNEQFEKNIRKFEVKLESGVKIDRGPLLQRKNAAWEIKEDLVRREEALEIIRTADVWYAYTEKTSSDADIAFNFMKSKIKDLPSVTSQPKTEHGEWISEMVDGEDWKGCKRQYYQPISCSKCHSPNHYKSTYCPNCGRRMIEPQESEG